MSSTAKAKTAKLSTPFLPSPSLPSVPPLPSTPLPSTLSFFRICVNGRALLIPWFRTVRTLLDFFNSIPNSKDTQMRVLQENIEWARSEKRIFLKLSLETQPASLRRGF
ncbi:hypothetical protein BD410DRAFT_789557 [Rickenella mellea]|uniref:26S proteasome regulatory subunit Rpn6 N-terminal domain-containing protein n=1 Tax=Rickenella mellea TaxID=50990 RepID=A0A4Y7Q1E4_9AGAM|nr:hypothetical protein BD410DRAFT_789557 [Rickenella mellea]